MKTRDSEVGRPEMVGYGIGDWGINFHFAMTANFLLIFYTDVFGLAPAVAGTVLLVARLTDALTDPLMGVIADRTRSRWGKLRPYLLFGAAPLGLASVLLFTVPPLAGAAKTAYAFATYTLWGVAFTAVTIPYSALTAAITPNAQQRVVLSSYRMGFATMGGGAIVLATPGLVALFATQAGGFRAMMLIYSLIGTVMLWISFASVTERVQNRSQTRPSPRHIIRVFRSNAPLWILMIVFTLGSISFTLGTGAKLYYFRYNLGREDLWGWYMLSMAIPALTGIIIAPRIAVWLGKARGMAACSGVTVLSGLGLYFTPYDQIPAIFAWSALAALSGTPISVFTWSIIPDTVEYSEWKTGVRAEGIIFSVTSFFQKTAAGLGGAISGFILSATGFAANQVQSPEALDGILSIITIVPGIFGALSIVALMFYRLDSETHDRIVAELAARRGPD